VLSNKFSLDLEKGGYHPGLARWRSSGVTGVPKRKSVKAADSVKDWDMSSMD
jgi:hypothetical protein